MHHLDRCLSCLSCMTTCAVKVDDAHLIDIVRAYIEDNYRRPLGDRMLRRLLADLLPYPRRFAHASRRRGSRAVCRSFAEDECASVDLPPRDRPPAKILRRRSIRPRAPERRARAAAGCVQQALARNVNAATIRLLQRHGCEVVVAAGVECCGALPLHMGGGAQGKALARG